MFLQEVSAAYVEDLAHSQFGASHHIVRPAKWASRSKLRHSGAPRGVCRSARRGGAGDADQWRWRVATRARHARRQDVYLASFHGDTNGLLSLPVVKTVAHLVADKTAIFGLDANTHVAHIEGKKQGRDEFMSACEELGLPTSTTAPQPTTRAHICSPSSTKRARAKNLLAREMSIPKMLYFTAVSCLATPTRPRITRGKCRT